MAPVTAFLVVNILTSQLLFCATALDSWIAFPPPPRCFGPFFVQWGGDNRFKRCFFMLGQAAHVAAKSPQEVCTVDSCNRVKLVKCSFCTTWLLSVWIVCKPSLLTQKMWYFGVAEHTNAKKTKYPGCPRPYFFLLGIKKYGMKSLPYFYQKSAVFPRRN